MGDQTGNDIGWAVAQMLNGKAVRVRTWANEHCALRYVGNSELIHGWKHAAHVVWFTTAGNLISKPYVAESSDLLSTDWMLVQNV